MGTGPGRAGRALIGTAPLPFIALPTLYNLFEERLPSRAVASIRSPRLGTETRLPRARAWYA